MGSKLTYRIKPTSDMCEFHSIDENTHFETKFENGEIVVNVIDQQEIKKQIDLEIEKFKRDCIRCEFFCEKCGHCSIPDGEVNETICCRCQNCSELCKEKCVCMRGEDN